MDQPYKGMNSILKWHLIDLPTQFSKHRVLNFSIGHFPAFKNSIIYLTIVLNQVPLCTLILEQ